MDAMGRAPQGSIAQVPSCGAGAEPDHSPNTYNTEALRCSLSSGALARRRLPLAGSVPDAIATYCLPLTSKVMGGAEKADPILIFHNSASEVSSKAATVPSIRPTKTRPPPVDSTPEKFGYGKWRFFLMSWVTGSTAVRLLSMRPTALALPPFQPRSALCLVRSTSTLWQPVKAGM